MTILSTTSRLPSHRDSRSVAHGSPSPRVGHPTTPTASAAPQMRTLGWAAVGNTAASATISPTTVGTAPGPGKTTTQDYQALPYWASYQGRWPEGELVAAQRPDWPAFLPLTDVASCSCAEDMCRRMLLLPASGVGILGVLAMHDIEWAPRSSRIQIASHTPSLAAQALSAAVDLCFNRLNFARLYGWHHPDEEMNSVLKGCGFELEATLPQGGWPAGTCGERQLWGLIRRD